MDKTPLDLIALFREMAAEKASDLYLTAGKPPIFRRPGGLAPAAGAPPVEDAALLDFIGKMLPAATLERFLQERDLDAGVSLADGERYRLHLGFEKNRPSMIVRRVPSGALDMQALRIPDAVRRLAEEPRGLVLVTGSTGSGKSTTMAAMLHHINRSFCRHVVTLEDPIEYLHQDIRSVIAQREIGTDARSFETALRNVVRQDPDVIMIGEMRDAETVRTAIAAAMTGHLVISTLHTADVCQTVERIVNFFPTDMREQIAADLSLALAGIVAQRLLPKTGGGLVPAFEILLATPLARKLIAARAFDQLEGDVLRAGAAEGMQTFTRALVALVEEGLVSVEDAVPAATNRDEFLLAVQGMETGIESLRRLAVAGDGGEAKGPSMRSLLRAAVRYQASDVLLTANSPPMLRRQGQLCECELAPLSATDTQRLLFSVLTPQQRAQFEQEKEFDFALSVSGLFDAADTEVSNYRFRVNGFYQKGTVAVAIRLIAQNIPDPRRLGIPPVVLELAKRHQGLILVTGPTGHGKSTTLACIIDEINRNRACHIITIEDPIEFVHANKKAIIEQREVYADTRGFNNALKYVLRQDPDVILIGEMRDQETISAALTAAETGHLVLATLHTNDAPQTMDRIVDAFPPEQQNQVRVQLASALLAVVAQRLLPKANDDTARIAAFEVMLASTAVRSLIRDKRTHQLLSAIETAARDGMITMDKALQRLLEQKLITRDTYRATARDPGPF